MKNKLYRSKLTRGIMLNLPLSLLLAIANNRDMINPMVSDFREVSQRSGVSQRSRENYLDTAIASSKAIERSFEAPPEPMVTP